MTITKTQTIDQITADEFGNITYRESTRIMEDGVEIGKSYHRSSLAPGASLVGIDPKVVTIARATWTPEVIAPFTKAVILATEEQAVATAALVDEKAKYEQAKAELAAVQEAKAE